MKVSLLFLCVFFALSSFTSGTSKDVIEVLYDSRPIDYKVGIKLEQGKELTIVNKSGGKIYKAEVFISLGRRPCYQKTYLNDEAAKPISVSPFMAGACAEATMIMLTVNLSEHINIPIRK